MSKALYRKYRSRSLDEIVGQKHVTDILARSLKAGRVAHAYLLTGPRGVGKTSIARILAHEINKLPYDEESSHLDIIEIDAASNNGVEDVRDLREKVQIAPVRAEKKIYIIDEVHMLSKAAFNALLKTLEEPPEHAVFILATTDADKLPATIISRTQRFSFRAISTADAVMHLRHIADEEKIKIDEDALELIAQRGDGSFRDSIGLLDQLRSVANTKAGITRQLVEESLGLAPAEHVEKLLAAYEAKDLKTIVALLDESDRSGIQPSVLVSQLIQTVRETIASKPQLVPLLDQLLDVAKSSQPSIKLLTVLAAHTVPKPKTAALTATPAEVSAPIKELERQAVRPSPAPSQLKPLNRRDVPDRASRAPQAGLQPPVERPGEGEVSVGEYEDKDTSTTQIAGPAARSTPASPEQAQVEAGVAPPRVTRNEPIVDFDWEKLIEYARQNFVAVYSVLSKCGYEIDGDKLILYTGNAFYKKKLDDSKHRVNLSKALIETGVGDVLVETIGTPPPPKDSTAAAVAAIMGGGEEVNVGE